MDPYVIGGSARAEPITKRTSRGGSVNYESWADFGSKPNGTRDRRRFHYRTLAEIEREYCRITTEVTTGLYARNSTLTVAEACDEWLAWRRGIRSVTLQDYTHDLKAVRRCDWSTATADTEWTEQP